MSEDIQRVFKVGDEVRVKTMLAGDGAIDKYAGTESVITRIASTKKSGERYYYLHTGQIADPLMYFFADELEPAEPMPAEPMPAEPRDAQIVQLTAERDAAYEALLDVFHICVNELTVQSRLSAAEPGGKIELRIAALFGMEELGRRVDERAAKALQSTSE